MACDHGSFAAHCHSGHPASCHRRGVGAVYWDNDGDLFSERSGWLSGEDGFLVHDADGSGTIDAAELFGGPGLSGFDERLAANDNRMNKFNGSVAA